MGMRGRKPMPRAQAALRGKHDNGRDNLIDLPATTGYPDLPKEYKGNKDKVDKWHTVCELLEQMGLLTVVDGPSIALYCDAWHNYCVYKDEEFAMTFENGTQQVSPFYTIIKNERAFMHSWHNEHGLNPIARSRLAVDPQKVKDSKLMAFVKKSK